MKKLALPVRNQMKLVFPPESIRKNWNTFRVILFSHAISSIATTIKLLASLFVPHCHSILTNIFT